MTRYYRQYKDDKGNLVLTVPLRGNASRFTPPTRTRSIGDTISLYVLLGLGAMLAALLIYQGLRNGF